MCLFVVNRSPQLLNNELKQLFENQSSGWIEMFKFAIRKVCVAELNLKPIL